MPTKTPDTIPYFEVQRNSSKELGSCHCCRTADHPPQEVEVVEVCLVIPRGPSVSFRLCQSCIPLFVAAMRTLEVRLESHLIAMETKEEG